MTDELLQQLNGLPEPDRPEPRYPIGTRVHKRFGREHRLYKGIVSEFDPHEQLYKVLYEDDDSEEFTEAELAGHIIHGDRPSTRMDSRLQARTTTPTGTAGSLAPLDPTLPTGDFLLPPEFAVQPNDTPAVRQRKERYLRLLGIGGESCYVLISDRRSGGLLCSIRRDKTPPIDFFRHFLAHYAPNAPDKRVRLDQGGELGGNAFVRNLFEEAGYRVDVTGAGASSQNGLVERPHRTIADGVRTMLYAAGLPPKFWPYALRHFVYIYNQVPHGNRKVAPVTICSDGKRRPNLSLLHVWGSRMYALPPGDRPEKAELHSKAGVFLGYHKTMKNAYYFDLTSRRIKDTPHVTFDEGYNDLSPDEAPPYVQFLRGTLAPEAIDLSNTEYDFTTSLSPFLNTVTVEVPFSYQADSAVPFDVLQCDRFQRAFAHGITAPFKGRTKKNTTKTFNGAYILRIGDYPTFSIADVREAIATYRTHDPPPPPISPLNLLLIRNLNSTLVSAVVLPFAPLNFGLSIFAESLP